MKKPLFSRRLLWSLIALLIISLFALVIHRPPSFINLAKGVATIENKNNGLPKIIENFRLQRQCVMDASKKYEGKIWEQMHHIINNCAFVYGLKSLTYMDLKTDKLFLPFQKSISNNPQTKFCHAVTLGVGNEIIYENALKEIYPNFCKYYGADPYPETADTFKSVGKVFYTAIDNVTNDKNNQSLNVLKNGKYDWENGIKLTSVGDFLKKMARIKFVHFLSMDIEGAEYRVIPYLAKNQAFARESDDATICQISAEFHGPLSFYNVSITEFESIWSSLLNSPYVLLNAYSPGNHHRFHLFNMENKQCLDLFICDEANLNHCK